MSTYLVIYERGDEAWGAYSPDLPGCVAVGASRAEVEKLMDEAVPFHLECMRAHGTPIPPPANFAGYVAA